MSIYLIPHRLPPTTAPLLLSSFTFRYHIFFFSLLLPLWPFIFIFPDFISFVICVSSLQFSVHFALSPLASFSPFSLSNPYHSIRYFPQLFHFSRSLFSPFSPSHPFFLQPVHLWSHPIIPSHPIRPLLLFSAANSFFSPLHYAKCRVSLFT